jgi:hypothetical protein
MQQTPPVSEIPGTHRELVDEVPRYEITSTQMKETNQESLEPIKVVVKREKSAGQLSTVTQFKRKKDYLPPTIP